MPTWVYEMSNQQLIEEFSRACAKSGLSNSGLVIDPMSWVYAREVRIAEEALLSRLDGKKPPFRLDDMVRPKSKEPVRSVDHYGISVSGAQKIQEIHYRSNGKWFLEFSGIPGGARGFPQFSAGDFEFVPSAAIANTRT